MKKLFFIMMVLCFTVATTTYGQSTKVATLDIYRLITATPFGTEYHNMMLNRFAERGAYDDLSLILEGFKETFQENFINVYKAIDPDIDIVIIARDIKVNAIESRRIGKVFYEKTPIVDSFFGGYLNPELDITDQVSAKYLEMYIK